MPSAEHPYVVHSSLHDDINEGWVWIRDLKNELDGKRRLIRVTAGTGKSIFCEALYADDWYMEKWIERWKNINEKVPAADANLAFISSWYRRRLGIGMGNQSLTIEYRQAPRPLLWQLYVCLEHPQVVVLLAI